MTRYLLLLMLTLGPSASMADGTDIERRDLARLVEEVDFLIAQVQTINKTDYSSHQPASRLSFRYSLLEADLILIRAGIVEYIQRTLRSGREIAPLSGHYVHGAEH